MIEEPEPIPSWKRVQALVAGDPQVAVRQLTAMLGDEAAAKDAASGLSSLASKGVDISDALPALEDASTSEETFRRVFAALAISKHKLNQGQESAIPLHPACVTDWCWEVDVYHRRTYGPSDESIGNPVFEGMPAPKVCAACGGSATRVIFYQEVVAVQAFLTYEILCTACGKYSVYSYED